MLVVVAGTAVILLLAWLLCRSIRKAAFLTSIAVVLCLSYGHVVNVLDKRTNAGYNFFTPISGTAVILLMAWAAIFGIAVYFVRWYWKKRWNPNVGKLTTLLNVVGAVLIIMPVVTIVVREAQGSNPHTAAPDTGDLQLSVPEQPPDIYYIILDRYACASTLEEKLDFDNSQFLDYLSAKGFYVAADSRDNYLSTQHSLASSLNMEYLDEVAQEAGETSADLRPLYAMMQDYKVWRC